MFKLVLILPTHIYCALPATYNNGNKNSARTVCTLISDDYMHIILLRRVRRGGYGGILLLGLC